MAPVRPCNPLRGLFVTHPDPLDTIKLVLPQDEKKPLKELVLLMTPRWPNLLENQSAVTSITILIPRFCRFWQSQNRAEVCYTRPLPPNLSVKLQTYVIWSSCLIASLAPSFLAFGSGFSSSISINFAID